MVPGPAACAIPESGHFVFSAASLHKAGTGAPSVEFRESYSDTSEREVFQHVQQIHTQTHTQNIRAFKVSM